MTEEKVFRLDIGLTFVVLFVTAILFVAKLTNTMTISWFWVFSPIIFGVAIDIFILLIILIIGGIVAAQD